MEYGHRLRVASNLADSSAADEMAEGFAMMAGIFSSHGDVGASNFGFLDNALFLARKRASHENPDVREAVLKMLLSVARTGAGKSAAAETAEEIALQPSGHARTLASRFFGEQGGRSR
jgi:hypothetical protein